jgi:hypothetical protein
MRKEGLTAMPITHVNAKEKRLWCRNRFDPSGELRAGFGEAVAVVAADH